MKPRIKKNQKKHEHWQATAWRFYYWNGKRKCWWGSRVTQTSLQNAFQAQCSVILNVQQMDKRILRILVHHRYLQQKGMLRRARYHSLATSYKNSYGSVWNLSVGYLIVNNRNACPIEAIGKRTWLRRVVQGLNIWNHFE